MKKLPLLLAFVVAAFMFSSDARAKIYFGASIGDATLEEDTSGFDGNDTGYKFYGGFRFFKFFGIEAAWEDFGNPDSGGANAEVQRFDVFAVGVIPIKRLELWGKIGVGYWDSKASLSGGGSLNDDGTDTSYGVGIGFELTRMFWIRAEYESFELDDIDDLTMVSIGLDIRF